MGKVSRIKTALHFDFKLKAPTLFTCRLLKNFLPLQAFPQKSTISSVHGVYRPLSAQSEHNQGKYLPFHFFPISLVSARRLDLYYFCVKSS